jgi:UDP-N-acetylmuramyl tripeptide synthase
MRLRQLVEALPNAQWCGDDLEITAITHDSRRVTQGALFVCLKGCAWMGTSSSARRSQRAQQPSLRSGKLRLTANRWFLSATRTKR